MIDLSAVAREVDREILSQLLRRGDDLSRPRDTVVYFYLRDGDQRHGATVRAELAVRLERDGWATRPTVKQDGVVGNREQAVNPSSVNALIEAMEATAAEYQVVFDGWACAAPRPTLLGTLLRLLTGRA